MASRAGRGRTGLDSTSDSRFLNSTPAPPSSGGLWPGIFRDVKAGVPGTHLGFHPHLEFNMIGGISPLRSLPRDQLPHCGLEVPHILSA